MSNGTNPPKKRGCLFYGCLSVAIVSLVLVLMLCVGFYFAKRKITQLINDYTDTTPQPIESVTYPPPERAALQSRLETFKAAVDKHEPQAELVLNATDLNVLIGENPDLKGKLFVELDDDQVKGKVAMPLPDIGPFRLKGRYLNGAASLRVALDGGKLNVRVNTVEVRGKALPGPIMTELKKNNLAESVAQNPNQARELEKFNSIEVKDSKVIIHGK
ncbi:MAG: hypothetical protein QOF48_3629 [Verrucomicrobiota bacterium]|jgi:hypothetical protein